MGAVEGPKPIPRATRFPRWQAVFGKSDGTYLESEAMSRWLLLSEVVGVEALDDVGADFSDTDSIVDHVVGQIFSIDQDESTVNR